MPTVDAEAWASGPVVICTPWLPNDLYADLEASGEFLVLKTPAYEEDGSPTWPEHVSAEFLETRKAIIGGAEFSRMYLLNPSANMERLMVYHSFPEGAIPADARRVGGVDYASVEGLGHSKLKYRSHFAMAWSAYIERGDFWVLEGGIVRQPSQAQAEEIAIRTQSEFVNWDYSVVETDGKGAEYFAVLSRNPGLRLVAEKTKGRSKEKRIINDLGVMLETGRLRISDKRDPFLDLFRRFLDSYPNVSDRSSEWDVADSVFWSVYHVMSAPMLREMPLPIHTPNPWLQLATWDGG